MRSARNEQSKSGTKEEKVERCLLRSGSRWVCACSGTLLACRSCRSGKDAGLVRPSVCLAARTGPAAHHMAFYLRT
jgi:hypothetical protein